MPSVNWISRRFVYFGYTVMESNGFVVRLPTATTSLHLYQNVQHYLSMWGCGEKPRQKFDSLVELCSNNEVQKKFSPKLRKIFIWGADHKYDIRFRNFGRLLWFRFMWASKGMRLVSPISPKLRMESYLGCWFDFHHPFPLLVHPLNEQTQYQRSMWVSHSMPS